MVVFAALLYKLGHWGMTSHYGVLRPVTPSDLDASPAIVEVLKMIPQRGRITYDQFKRVGRDKACRGLAYACSCGILGRISPYEQILKLDSVRFWTTQLNDHGFKNADPGTSTKKPYLRGISKLNEWLPGRTLQSYKTVMRDGQITRQAIAKSFANVEDVVQSCMESDHGTRPCSA